ncbi:hypothetical protein H261_03358 [Paramagnetospirillum caucaseum]|uniref:HD superfamily hydrolase n=1 Tax=Paramagnetospirillum caucaseum TaxID=1244869 RepID=M3AFR7_9PROT|nr:hypothetical protein [Paramagnetospirillum caucaseum]EME71414.1 hypothetical protein H261_03358 [Paramagnetospirillum caucaseum]
MTTQITPANTGALFLQQASGGMFRLDSPLMESVHWPDIAECLAKEPRFAGATRNLVFSVAQHCDLVGRIAEGLARKRLTCDEQIRRAALAGHIHDAHEFATRDIPTPTKDMLARLAGTDVVRQLQAHIDAALYPAAGLPWPLPATLAAIVAEADAIACATEKRDLMAEPILPWGGHLPAALPERLTPWPPRFVEIIDRWWRRFQVLTGDRPTTTIGAH